MKTKSIIYILLLVFYTQNSAFSQHFRIQGYTNGQSITRCQRDGLILQASQDPTYTDYRWYFNSTTSAPVSSTPTLNSTIIDPRVYQVTIVIATVDSAGFRLTSSIEVFTAAELPKPNIGNVTYLCEGETITLQNTTTLPPGISYLWNNTPSMNQPTLNVTTGGLYRLQIANTIGCRAYDTVEVVKIPNLANLGNDKILCDGSQLSLAPIEPPYNNTASYLWSTGSIAREINILAEGEYRLNVAISLPKNCTFSDTINTDRRPTPTVDLGDEDILGCKNQPLTLFNKSFAPINNTSQISWNTGATTQTLQVTSPGTYQLRLTSPDNCIAEDEITVDFFFPVVDIGGDQFLCEGNTIMLENSINIPQSIYTWNGVIGTNSLTVTDAGSYELILTHPKAPNCSESAIVNIELKENPIPDLGIDIQDSSEYVLDGTKDGIYTKPDYLFSWINIDNSTILGSDEFIILTSGVEIKLIITETESGCSGEDILLYERIQPELKKHVFMPTAFSPSANKPENRVFKINAQALSEENFLLRIYDKWGGVVFENTILEGMRKTGWDGSTDAGKTISSGTYTVVLSAEYRDGEKVEKIQTVTYIP